MPVYIYGLFCPLAEAIRYIGKSTNPKQRLRAHVSSAVRHAYDHHTARWIRKLISVGLTPELRILREVLPTERWQDVEREWIATESRAGVLTNTTLGGEGLDYADDEDKQRYLSNLAAAMERYRSTPSGREAWEKFRLSSADPEVQRRRLDSIRLAYSDPRLLERVRAINGDINRRPSVKALRSADSKARWSSPDGRRVIMEAFARPETKAKQSERKKASWADPVVGAKLRAIHSSEEVRAKKSAAARRRATPEYRAMMAEKTRLAWEKRRQKG